MKSPTAPKRLDAFAVTAPGLEALCAAELRALGLPARAADGGVSWTGDLQSVARANLWLRTASRVIVRVAEFRALAFYELEMQAKRIPWERFVRPNALVEFRVTCRKSKLYHSDAVAQRFAEALAKRVAGVTIGSAKGDVDEETAGADRQLFIVRFLHDECTVSIDSSGALLHLRGYRQAVAKAPLRETLAAAILLGADWAGDVPLVDPMCGSGTIPIEAARLARRIAPGRDRDFAFTRWPGTDEALLTSLVDDARSRELASSPVAIAGSDRDKGAIAAATANAERAGVASDIEWCVQPISAVTGRSGPGVLASNPPYGVRIGDADRLRNLYAQIGNVARTKLDGWTVALLTADRQLEQQLRMELHERFRTKNGGIPVHLMVGTALSDESRGGAA